MFHLRRKPKLQTMNAEPEMVPRKISGQAKQMPPWAKQPLQRSLKVNQPGDRYEQEADRVAEKVMRMPEPRVQRRCACGGAAGPDGECAACRAQRLMLQRQEMLEEEQEVGALQRKTAHAGETAGHAPSSVHQTLSHSGQPLDSRTRAYMEPRFGQDFSGVRVHTDQQAAQSAADVNARAYTVGNDVVFGAGQYQPGSSTGNHLIAHELAHTVQQQKNRVSPLVRQQTNYQVMKEGFESTVRVCHRVLIGETRFRVLNGGVRVVIDVEELDRNIPGCDDFRFYVTLTKVGEGIFSRDNEIATCSAVTGGVRSFSFSSVPRGTYYLKIWRNFDHPHCCLVGDVFVFDERVSLDSGNCEAFEAPSFMEVLHTALDAAGMIPALGIVPDAVNAGMYSIEGDWVNAGISSAAMIPIFGQGATATKYGVRVTREAIARTGRRRIAAGLRAARTVVPQGFTVRQFRRFARGVRRLHRQARLPQGELVLHGSRVRGTARAASDIDVALLVDERTFFDLAEQSLSRARPGTRLRETMLRRIRRNGQLSSFDLGTEFQGLRRELVDTHSPVAVQFSVLKRGGRLDTGPFLPLD